MDACPERSTHMSGPSGHDGEVSRNVHQCTSHKYGVFDTAISTLSL
jgi:hypothetical protein